jgi:hypothetical protein
MEVVLPDHLVHDSFWLKGEEDKFNWIEHALPEEVHKEIVKKFFAAVSVDHKIRVWGRCADQGITADDLAELTGMDKDNLNRGVKKGTTSWEVIWLASVIANLDAECLKYPPFFYCHLVGCASAAEWLRHREKNYDSDVGSAKRDPVSPLSIPHAALLQAITSDEGILDKWFQMTTPIRNELTKANRDPRIASFISDLYEAAESLAEYDSPEVSTLQKWSPRQSGLTCSLQRIAQAWNQYQTHWYLVQGECRFAP